MPYETFKWDLGTNDGLTVKNSVIIGTEHCSKIRCRISCIMMKHLLLWSALLQGMIYLVYLLCFFTVLFLLLDDFNSWVKRWRSGVIFNRFKGFNTKLKGWKIALTLFKATQQKRKDIIAWPYWVPKNRKSVWNLYLKYGTMILRTFCNIFQRQHYWKIAVVNKIFIEKKSNISKVNSQIRLLFLFWE